MTKEKEIGLVITAEASREDLEKKAYDTLKPSVLALLRKLIANGYRTNGTEGEVTVRLTVLDRLSV